MQVRYGMQTVNAITYSVGDINVSGWHLLALLAGLLDLLHVPDAQSRASALRPHLLPSLILQGSLSIRLTLDTAHQWTGEVHLVRVREGERVEVGQLVGVLESTAACQLLAVSPRCRTRLVRTCDPVPSRGLLADENLCVD